MRPWLGLALLAVCGTAQAQFNIPGGGQNPLEIRNLIGSLTKQTVLSSSLDDADRGIKAFDGWQWGDFEVRAGLSPSNEGVLTLPRGRMALQVQSFCLRAGGYGPNLGMGYGHAPYLGPQANIIQNVIRRHSSSEVPQKSTQQLLWAMISRVKPSDMTGDARQALILLQPQEIAVLESNAIKVVEDRLMGPVLRGIDRAMAPIVKAENDLRAGLTRAGTSFEDLERIAVPEAPADIKSEIDAGRWLADGRGAFFRYKPQGYRNMTVDVVVPRAPELIRDQLNRIVTMNTPGGTSFTVTYADEFQPKAIPGKPWALAYPIKAVKVTDGTNEATLEVQNFIICSAPVDQVGAWRASTMPLIQDWWGAGRDYAQDRLGERYGGRAYEAYDEASDAYDLGEQAYDIGTGNASADRALDVGHYVDGVDTAVRGTSGERLGWIAQTHANLAEALMHATNVIAGLGEPEGGNGGSHAFNPPGGIAMPGNRGSQRLGVSSRGW